MREQELNYCYIEDDSEEKTTLVTHFSAMSTQSPKIKFCDLKLTEVADGEPANFNGNMTLAFENGFKITGLFQTKRLECVYDANKDWPGTVYRHYIKVQQKEVDLKFERPVPTIQFLGDETSP